jgi:16S rRNA (uracil1498-N3)-methyltransferase
VTTPRIYLPKEMEVGHRLELGEDHIRYIRNVLRLKTGDRLVLFSGKGYECDAVIRELDTDATGVEILEKRQVAGAGIRITLAQALPKGQKMDFIVQKATELGVSRVIPFHSFRSIPRLSEEKARLKTSRWQKIAVEASRQCGRADVPEVTDIRSFAEVLEAGDSVALKLFLWEEEKGRGIKEVLRDENLGQAIDFFIIVGPEGGFEQTEVNEALKHRYVSVSLGPRVLKVETAAVVVLAIIQYERDPHR